MEDLKNKIEKIIDEVYVVDDNFSRPLGISQYYKREFNSDIVFIKNTSIEIEFTFLYEQRQRVTSMGMLAKLTSKLRPILGEYTVDNTEICIEDPEGSGYEGFGDVVFLKYDFIPLSQRVTRPSMRTLLGLNK